MIDVDRLKETIKISDILNINSLSKRKTSKSFLLDPCPFCAKKGHFWISHDLKGYSNFGCRPDDRGDVIRLYSSLHDVDMKTAFAKIKEMADLPEIKNVYTPPWREIYQKYNSYFARLSKRCQNAEKTPENIMYIGYINLVLDQWERLDANLSYKGKALHFAKLKTQLNNFLKVLKTKSKNEK